MTDVTRTLRHKYSVQIEIDPAAWATAYGSDDVMQDSQEYLLSVIEGALHDYFERASNGGKVRYVAWESTGPGVSPVQADRVAL